MIYSYRCSRTQTLNLSGQPLWRNFRCGFCNSGLFVVWTGARVKGDNSPFLQSFILTNSLSVPICTSFLCLRLQAGLVEWMSGLTQGNELIVYPSHILAFPDNEVACSYSPPFFSKSWRMVNHLARATNL